MNLTAVRDSAVLVGLHFGECLQAAQRIPPGVKTVLDFGSGAGLPGILIQIARPDLQVTLAESQKKKAAFLREAVRELELDGATVHAGRVEDLPSTAEFDLVALRAVDKMEDALKAAIPRIRRFAEGRGGWCMVLTSNSEVSGIVGAGSAMPDAKMMHWLDPEEIPRTDQRVILLGSRNG